MKKRIILICFILSVTSIFNTFAEFSLLIFPHQSMENALSGNYMNDPLFVTSSNNPWFYYSYVVKGLAQFQLDIYNGSTAIYDPTAYNVQLAVAVNDPAYIHKAVLVVGSQTFNLAPEDFQYGNPVLPCTGNNFPHHNVFPAYYVEIPLGDIQQEELLAVDVDIQGEPSLLVQFEAYGRMNKLTPGGRVYCSPILNSAYKDVAMDGPPVLNKPPVASDLSVVTDEDVPVSVDLIATDPDGDSLSYSIITYPEHGSLSAAGSVITYTPAADYNGTDSFIYCANDGVDNSNPATVDITIIPVNDAPVAVDLTFQVMTNHSLDLTLGGSDIDEDILTWYIAENPQHGYITVNGQDVTYYPDYGFSGQDQFSYYVSDGLANSDPATVTINVIDIDLSAEKIDISRADLDYEDMIISGEVDVTVLNNGSIPVTLPFDITVYVKHGVLPLGVITLHQDLAPGDTIVTGIPVDGPMVFRDNPIYAFVDSSDVIIESNENNNITNNKADCEVQLPVGQFNPQVEWAWTSSSEQPDALNIMMTPVVIDLDGDSVPEIVFGSTASRGGGTVEVGYLRAVRGDSGSEVFSVTDSSYRINTCSSLAAGDIDLDGKPEIIACDASGHHLIAFEHDGSFKWISPVTLNIYWGAPSIADLDMDGVPEIIIGNTVLNNDGNLVNTGSGGIGSNGVGPISLVADINLDGSPEIVAGNTIYDNNTNVIVSLPIGDGFNAVANFNSDPYPEIVLVSSGSVYLFTYNGVRLWGPVSIPGGGSGGPPTIADFDGDGEVEIGVAGSSRYCVLNTDGSVLWTSPTQDKSSNATGSSVFDFEGDGLAEVVYSDELYVRIYAGRTGAVLYQQPLSSCTWHEYPVIADVDNDNNAEIAVVANNNCGYGGQRGLYVIGDANDTWVNTRNIWNQHTYHVTNINDNGTIPRVEVNNWEIYNSYRQNHIQNPKECEDFSTSLLDVNTAGLPQSLEITVRVGNSGYLDGADVLNVAFYDGSPAGGILIGVTTTSFPLASGDYEDLTITWNNPPSGMHEIYAVADDDGTGRGRVRESDEQNNSTSLSISIN